MDDLTAAAAALSGVLSRRDEASRFGFQLHERLPVLLALRNQLDAALARTVRHGELSGLPEIDGHTTMASWLRGHGRLSGAAAQRLVAVGRSLENLPAADAALASGSITADQVTVLGQIATDDRRAAADAEGLDLAEVDATLTALAAAGTHQDTVLGVGHYLARLDPDGPEPDPTADRGLTLPVHGDGSRGIRGQLDAIGGEKVATALESLVQADRPAGDTRTRAQQLADALVQLCDTHLAAGELPTLRGRKPQVTVVVPLEDLLDPTTGPGAATLGLGAQVSAARARLLACDSQVTRVLMGPDSQPLDLGRSHRIVPAHLRKAVELRDRGCVFTGCGAPKYWCDVHHLVHWIDDGPTSLENSALLCERHHTKVHHGFRVERQPDNSYRTFRPDDTEIVVGPRLPGVDATPLAPSEPPDDRWPSEAEDDRLPGAGANRATPRDPVDLDTVIDIDIEPTLRPTVTL